MILVPPREDSGILGACEAAGCGTAAATLAAAALDSATLDSATTAPFAVDSASNGLAVHDLTQKS
ncbi:MULTISPECIES: hypothetical protein [Microbacterium]|uniref:Uncharacterized protein n=2 Tax=Microbacterium maritypicum TaxID=33918 RepID=A0ACD4B661_MICMQ|nr:MULTISPECIES: hypothetical protein [Microbacterium]EYT60927.1 hypothetical protein D514_0106490 [Microbacterium sp. UCD-TDU]MBP5803614.1 hypothetical protein [Microbacterium liquefaciens]UTT52927.1 hypothetical protein NMQ05_17890 [Microbacterium liquefaciens]WEF21018.1 hypothetical protein PWF71_17285 [Microbacterium liquefaciens]